MPLASQYYDAEMKAIGLEGALDDALLRAIGADPDKTDTWPCGSMIYDWYDNSFELLGTRDDYLPTPEHLAACWALGFMRGWICYTDRTEIYFAPGVQGERKASRHDANTTKRDKADAAALALQARAREQEELKARIRELEELRKSQ